MARGKAASSPGDPKITHSKDRRFLMAKLTPEEMSDCAQRLAQAEDTKTQVDAELKATSGQMKGRIKQLEADIGQCVRKLKDRAELRSVDCDTVMNWTDCTVTVTRLDTNEVIEGPRNMTGDEKQLRMDWDKDGQKKEPGKPAEAEPKSEEFEEDQPK